MARILIVDDSLFMRMMIKKLLVGGAHEVVGEAGSSAEALTMYQALRPDLVTMDIIMPKESGLEAIRHIIAQDRGARIIVISAMGQKQVVEQALALGAKGFVHKPIKSVDLLACIGEALA